MQQIDPLSPMAFAQAYEAQQNPDAADRGLRVTFFLDEVLDEAATTEAGRPIHKSVEMCEIKYGDKDNVVVDRVKYMKPDPRQRFPVQWAKFKAGEKEQVVGTLLRKWGLIETALAKDYEAIGIMTVEQLAGLSDELCKRYRGSIADRQKARDFLAMADGQAPIAAARAEIEALREEIRALRDGGAQGMPAVAPIETKRRPGRPRKEVAEG